MLRRLFPLPISLRALCVVLVDLGLLWVASSGGAALWQWLHAPIAERSPVWPILALLCLCLIGCGAVSPDGLRARADMLVRVMAGLSLGAILLAIGHIAQPGFARPVGAQMIMLLLALPMHCLSRLAFSHLADTPYFARRLFVLGTSDGYARVASIVAHRPGLRLLGHLEVDAAAEAPDAQVTQFILGQGVDELILATACRQHWPVRALVPLRLWSSAALFWQERVGEFGRRFWLVKLRSMGVHAEADGQARWAEEDDPRVTRLGRWLRQLHIDELPQLWNILRGEMSFVGPRPERPEFVIQLEAEIPYYAERHHLRPGITGWAQINYPYAASLQDARAKLEFDLF